MSFSKLIAAIVASPDLHARWLNTLSLMENTGARKISASEHATDVTLIVLKHAAEEHRHAYYLKKQIDKIGAGMCPDYSAKQLLSPLQSRHYLNRLDTEVCRYLKALGTAPEGLKFAAYLLVTYAIELRADELYPVYQKALDAAKSKVNVKSIILEEEGHLEEMTRQLEAFSPDWKRYADAAVAIETKLFNGWVDSLVNIPGIA
jgi:hypothetical protein